MLCKFHDEVERSPPVSAGSQQLDHIGMIHLPQRRGPAPQWLYTSPSASLQPGGKDVVRYKIINPSLPGTLCRLYAWADYTTKLSLTKIVVADIMTIISFILVYLGFQNEVTVQ